MISDERAEQFVVLETNSMGVIRGDFVDSSGSLCSIQQWRTLNGDIWLGTLYDAEGRDSNYGMRLSRANVVALLPLLTEFAETGELSNVNKGFFCAHCCETFLVSPEHPVKFCAICGDEFDVVADDKKEPALSEHHSCPECKGEFGTYETVEYHRLMGSLWCPYCGHDFFEEET